MSDVIGQLRRDLEDLRRMVAQLLMRGVVRERDSEKGYRVSLGKDDEGNELLSPWIPHPENGKTSVPLKVGQPVAIASAGGDLRQAGLIPVGYSDDHPTPNQNLDANVFDDAGVRVEVVDSEALIVGDVKIIGNVTIIGNTDFLEGYVKSSGKKIDHSHRHSEVIKGPDKTGTPVGG